MRSRQQQKTIADLIRSTIASGVRSVARSEADGQSIGPQTVAQLR
jgi:hypothetical protein